MPLFDYECKSCGERFETLLKSSGSAEAVTCPACGKAKTERLLSAFAFNMNGGRPDRPPCGMDTSPGSCGMNPAGCPSCH